MNLLDRHIFKSVLFTCAAAVALFVFVLVFGNVVRDLLNHVLSGQLPVSTFFQLLGQLVLAMIQYALPGGVLTGVLLTLGRLSGDSEITAMRAAGISLFRIARPILILGVLGLAYGLYVNFESMPRARVRYHRELIDAIRADPLRIVIPKTFVRNFKGAVLYVGEKRGTEMRDIWIWQYDDDDPKRQITRVIHAESGRFEYNEETNTLVPVLSRVSAESRNEKEPENFAESPVIASSGELASSGLGLDRVFGRATIRRKHEWMTLAELRAEDERLARKEVPPEERKQHERERMKVSIALHEKINWALAVLSFALVGTPLGIKVSRRETSANLGMAVLLGLGYYILTVMVGWLDRTPEFRPDLLLWLPNLIFIGLGIWLFTRIERR